MTGSHFGVTAKVLGGKKPEKIIGTTGDLLLAMLGGRWPKFRNFNFDEVDVWKFEDKLLVPYDFTEMIIPGPSFMVTMVDDMYSDPPTVIVPKGFCIARK